VGVSQGESRNRDVYVISVLESATMDSKKSILFAKIPTRIENITCLDIFDTGWYHENESSV
jgi:hypothetical protein